MCTVLTLRVLLEDAKKTSIYAQYLEKRPIQFKELKILVLKILSPGAQKSRGAQDSI